MTLGPKGRNVVIDKAYGAPRITKDGVTVAKEIELADKFENMGAQMVREVASKTNDLAGDGTTTATVLAASILREGAKLVAAGMNPMDLRRGIDLGVAAVVKEIRAQSTKVKSSEEIAQVGTIAANGDATVGEMIAKPMKKVGSEGVISVEEAKTAETELEVVEGMQFDRGYLSPYFVTNVEKMRVELEDPYILIHEKKLGNLHAMLPILEAVVQSGKPLLIISEDVEGGGVALLRARAALASLTGANADVTAGISIVLRALEAPVRQIAENAGVEGSIVVGRLTDSKDRNQGFDAQTETYVDMIKAGIVDPAKVVRTALQDAGSIAALLITAEAMIADAPARDSMPAAGSVGVGGMGY